MKSIKNILEQSFSVTKAKDLIAILKKFSKAKVVIKSGDDDQFVAKIEYPNYDEVLLVAGNDLELSAEDIIKEIAQRKNRDVYVFYDGEEIEITGIIPDENEIKIYVY